MDVNLDVCFVGISAGFVVLWTKELGQRTLLIMNTTDLSDVGVWVDSHEGMYLTLFDLIIYLIHGYNNILS